MKDNQTIAQFLKVKAFPFIVKDDKGNVIYCEASNGFWVKRGYDDESNEIYYEASNGYWVKCEYDDESNVIYSIDSKGFIIDIRPKPMIELTLADIAKLKGVDVRQIRIKE